MNYIAMILKSCNHTAYNIYIVVILCCRYIPWIGSLLIILSHAVVQCDSAIVGNVCDTAAGVKKKHSNAARYLITDGTEETKKFVSSLAVVGDGVARPVDSDDETLRRLAVLAGPASAGRRLSPPRCTRSTRRSGSCRCDTVVTRDAAAVESKRGPRCLCVHGRPVGGGTRKGTFASSWISKNQTRAISVRQYILNRNSLLQQI